ncbi:hypothetical protein MMC31_002961, partial [Peltigera leucophlebia]|nr:hypothetical protein [Peltigera leucophlebia]
MAVEAVTEMGKTRLRTQELASNKHLDMQYHYIKEFVIEGELAACVSSSEMLADGITKAFVISQLTIAESGWSSDRCRLLEWFEEPRPSSKREKL